MKISQILEYRDMCNVCGQTPCNCTHVMEDAEPMDREFALVKKLGRLGERIVQNPKLWDRYDQAIDTENTDWIVGLIQDGTGATADEVMKLADLFGEMGGGLGRLTDFAWAVKQGTWDKDFMDPYRAHRSQDLNEFARDDDGRDDGGEDPYKYPKPQHYERSIDFFGRFEADHFDDEEFDKNTGVFKGYWDDEQGRDQIAYFKFDNPQRTSDDDPGMGWYYEPQNESINEFAPPGDENSGEDDNLHQYAKMWYNGDDATKQQVEQILDRMGWEIGPLESEEGGCFVVRPGDENGDTYTGFTPEELAEGVAEGSGNIGSTIKSLYQKIYNAGDDEIEYFYNDSPIFAQYWDEYEGDLDSIIAEVDPSELQVILDELESYVQNANLTEGQLDEAEQIFYARNPDGTRTYARVKDGAQLAQLQQKYAGSEVKMLPFGTPEVDQWLQSRGVNLRSFMPGMVVTRGLQEDDATPKEKEADYGPDYQDMVARVKKLAGLGPLKTVYDPQKRVYKNVPTAVQPKKEQ